MRIGLICPYSLSVPGGVQGQVLGLARAFRRRGHETRVLAPCDGPPPDLFVTPLGNSVPTATNGSIAPIAPDIPAQLRTLRAMWDEDFDVLHLHEPFVPGPTATACLVKPAPLVATFHAAGSQPAYQMFEPVAKWFGRRLDARIVVSDDALAMVQGPVGGEFEVLFNGIEADRFANAEPWPTERPAVLFIGRHEPRKGLEVLLRSLEHLPHDCSIWVAGVGPQTEDLQQRFGDPRIEWLGRIDDDERDRRMAAASVFCAPSLGGESFGIILLEAMAARTPVVASSIPGYAKVATTPDDERAAWLVEPEDAEGLAKAMAEVLDDPVTAARRVELAAVHARRFDLDLLADAYLDIYRRVGAG